MRRIRILIADDHPLVAEGLRQLLNAEYEVVGISSNGRSVLTDAIRLQPDIVLLDIAMPELNGIEAARRLRKLVPSAQIVFVTQQIDVQYLRAAFRAGGIGYCAKQSASTEILAAVRRAAAGKPYVTSLLKASLPSLSLQDLRQASDIFPDTLTPRQREVLQLVAEGKSVKEISASLNISSKTVEFHKSALMNELGIRTTAELTRYAISRGIVTLN
ncbi:response regulator [Terriglobus albidus]|uniref:response regulator n=1 Tax=Terriglobus albidus TaxID=1592106 RepID=UPI0021E047A1|nr:response regulator transcription factor [Terriglobus albidus]